MVVKDEILNPWYLKIQYNKIQVRTNDQKDQVMREIHSQNIQEGISDIIQRQIANDDNTVNLADYFKRMQAGEDAFKVALTKVSEKPVSKIMTAESTNV